MHVNMTTSREKAVTYDFLRSGDFIWWRTIDSNA